MNLDFHNKKCPYCNEFFELGDEVVYCQDCFVPHHWYCWDQNAGCSTFGCTGIMSEVITSEHASVTNSKYSFKLADDDNKAKENHPKITPRKVNNYNKSSEKADKKYDSISYGEVTERRTEEVTRTVEQPSREEGLRMRPKVQETVKPQELVSENTHYESVRNNVVTSETKATGGNSKFEKLYEDKKNIIQHDVPIMLDNVAIVKDSREDKLFVRCRFKALSDRAIKAIMVELYGKGVWDTETKKLMDFQYMDLNTKHGELFGQTTPIPLEDNSIREVQVRITKLSYEDGEICDCDSEYIELSESQNLMEFLEVKELVDEYKRLTTPKAEYVITEADYIWRCTCGVININREECSSCNSQKELLKDLLDRRKLANSYNVYSEEQRIKQTEERREREERKREAEERIRKVQEEKEAREKAEAEERKLKKKKKINKISIITGSVVGTVALALLLIFVIIPFARYKGACSNVDKHKYDKAYETFVDLDDYKDSKKKATETIYKKGQYLSEQGQYIEAAETFERIPDYEDSKTLAEECRDEASYQDAMSLYEAGSYLEAADGFEKLGSYSDSKDWKNKSRYDYATKMLNEGNYKEAYTYFDELGNYEDSASQANEAQYLYGKQLDSEEDYKTAIQQYEDLNNFKDSKDLLKDARYNYAVELYNDKDYVESAELFNLIRDYKDVADYIDNANYYGGQQLCADGEHKKAVLFYSRIENGGFDDLNEKINEAKYGYVKKHKNSTDTTTYNYLKDLKAIGYSDASSIYEDLYAWEAKITPSKYSTYTTTPSYTSSKYSTTYFHFEIKGGPPGESTTLKYSMTWPDGSSHTGYFDGDWKSGYTGSFYGWYNNPAYGATGTMWGYVYDENGNMIGSASIELTY